MLAHPHIGIRAHPRTRGRSTCLHFWLPTPYIPAYAGKKLPELQMMRQGCRFHLRIGFMLGG